MKITASLTTLTLTIAALGAGCATVQSIGYSGGWVKTSTVAYRFQGPPLLQSMEGSHYHVTVDGFDGAQAFAIPTLDANGMQLAENGTDHEVNVHVSFGDVNQGKPGAIQLGSKWYPAFEVTVPYEIRFHHAGDEIADRSGHYSNAITFRQLQSFESREDAVGAIDAIRQLAQKGIIEQAYSGAHTDARKATSHLAQSFFLPRNISMDVPIVRSAAGVDMNEAYELVSAAKGPEPIQEALDFYENLGTNQFNADGTDNNTANYGIACGVAACRLLLRDLHGAWAAAEIAAHYEPHGDEVAQIRRVIYNQERETGIRVIPQDEREEIDAANDMAEGLQNLFEGFVND